MSEKSKGISTAEWKKAGLPFEGWLRYAQLTEEARAEFDTKFFAWMKERKQ